MFILFPLLSNLLIDKGTIIEKGNSLQTFTEVSLNYPNLDAKEVDNDKIPVAFKSKIIEYLNTIPTSGLKGTITVLGEPYIRQGDIVNLKIDVSRINGITYNIEQPHTSYYVEEVITKFDNSVGIKQQLTLGNKVGTKLWAI